MQKEPSLSDVITALEKTFEAEKAALLSGAYDVIGAAAEEKERLSGLLAALLSDQKHAAQFPAYRRRTRKLLEAAKENEELLRAAKVGVASAQSRIKDVLKQQRMVGVYAESGDKLIAPGASVTRQKFA